ncbi:dihydroxyacetone kinase phosphoprotein-dependent L subunit [Planotetraspora sp. GP83]
MLDAACPGEVFTSPVPDQMIEAGKGVDGGAGVLHIVKNYTGDVLNFEMAAELCADEGVEVASVLVNDDVAVRDSLYTAGRRGTGATLFVEKIAGALAETGAPLADVARIGREVNERSRSFGVALTPCTVPAAGKPTFELGDTEIELGIGIHGEPGRTRTSHGEAREIVRPAMGAIHDDLPLSGETLVLVNGMGGTPLMELYILFAEVFAYLQEKGATAVRSLVGNYVTSLDMQGFSVTVCQLTDELSRLWDAPVDPRAPLGPMTTAREEPLVDTPFFLAWIEEIATAVQAERDRLTELDAAIGDADHGANLDRGFMAVRQALADGPPGTHGAVLVLAGSTLIRKVGGASGPLYGTAFRQMGRTLGEPPEVALAELAAAFDAALAGVQKLGGAAEGDKTMEDALAAAAAVAVAVAAEASRPWQPSSTPPKRPGPSASSDQPASWGDHTLLGVITHRTA